MYERVVESLHVKGMIVVPQGPVESFKYPLVAYKI